MIGAGQHVRIQMWNGDEVVQDGLLEPGCDISLRFSDGPQIVTAYALTRLTQYEADELFGDTPAKAVF